MYLYQQVIIYVKEDKKLQTTELWLLIVNNIYFSWEDFKK